MRKAYHSHLELEQEDKAYSSKNRIRDLNNILDSYPTVLGNYTEK